MTSTEETNKNIWQVCRLCMSKMHLTHLFTTDRNLYLKLTVCSLVQVQDGDGFPPFICELCEVKLCSFYDFKKQCEATEMKLKEALISEHYSVERFSEKEADMLSDNVNIDDFLYETDELDIVENDKINCVSNKHKAEKQKLKKIKLNLKLKRKQKYDEETAIRVKQFVNVNEKVSADVSDSSENKSSKLWHTPENILNKTQNACKQFQCQLCGDVFKWKSVLKKHLNTHSPNKAKFACSLCPKRFTRKEYISIHMRIHAGVRPFVCEICARSFVKRQDLIRHKSLHSDERNFSCSECNKKFKRSADVHAHMRTHTGVVPYSCKRCSKGYKSRTGMLKHYNKNQCGGLHVLTKCEIANIDIHNNENKRS